MPDRSTRLTWRVYRDRTQAPVPLIKSSTPSTDYSYVPNSFFKGDIATVETYLSAYGLLSGSVYQKNNQLPTSVLADEPILIKREYDPSNPPSDGLLNVMAVPLGFSGTGDNVYYNPTVRTVNGQSVLFVPTDSIPGTNTTLTFTASNLGRGVFRIPSGFPLVTEIKVSGQTYSGLSHYDAYHGSLYLQLIANEPDVVSSNAVVEITVDTSACYNRPLLSLPIGSVPVYEDPSGNVSLGTEFTAEGDIIGFVNKSRRIGYVDTRKRAPVLKDALRYHRIGHAYFDASPISTSHLMIIQTDAPPSRLESAVRSTLPGGTIYRQVSEYIPGEEVFYDADLSQ